MVCNLFRFQDFFVDDALYEFPKCLDASYTDNIDRFLRIARARPLDVKIIENLGNSH